MALPALTPDMPAVVAFGPRGNIVRGSLKTCAEVLKSRIGEPIESFKVVDQPGQEPRELSAAEIKRVVGAFG